MFKRVLLASDCTRTSLVALREGALIAQTFRAKTHLLLIDHGSPMVQVAAGLSMQPCPQQGQDLLDLGLKRLRQLGVDATGELAKGVPAQLIADAARSLRVDLIVVGHQRQSFIDRWWSGPNGAYIVDTVDCSVLIARDTISDEEFDRHLSEGMALAPDR